MKGSLIHDKSLYSSMSDDDLWLKREAIKMIIMNDYSWRRRLGIPDETEFNDDFRFEIILEHLPKIPMSESMEFLIKVNQNSMKLTNDLEKKLD